MSNEPKHTATPWHQDGLVVKDSQNNIIAYIESERSDAARIVQCVNEHDGLIEQIESLRAENAELIEALRNIRTVLYMCENSLLNCGYGVESSTIKSIQKTVKTFAKYQKP